MIELARVSMAELEAGVAAVEDAPRTVGVVELIVRRPDIGEREVLECGQLNLAEGLVGDNWKQRGSRHTIDGAAHPEMQLNVMNARAIALVAPDRSRWPLAGDQLYIDLDLSPENLPPGTRLAVGTAVIEVTAIPHNGCKKFRERFGLDAVKFFASPVGRALRLRGINARVVQPGQVRPGDLVCKLIAAP